jgi:hypothetical protein
MRRTLRLAPPNDAPAKLPADPPPLRGRRDANRFELPGTLAGYAIHPRDGKANDRALNFFGHE